MYSRYFTWTKNIPFNVKIFQCKSILPHSFHAFSIKALWEVGLFQSHILFPTESLYCGLLGGIFWKNIFTLICHTCSGKLSYYAESRWAKNGQGCLPSEICRPNSCQGNGIIPIKPCVPTSTLWDERCMLGSIWVALFLTPREMDDLQPELLFWRYVDADVKHDPSDGWFTLTKIIISIFNLMETTVIHLQR